MWVLDPVAIMSLALDSPVRSSQTDNVDSPHIATANLGANGNRFHSKTERQV